MTVQEATRQDGTDAKLSRRPSRLGAEAGATERPDRELGDEGFKALLNHALQSGRAAPNLSECIDVLLTLDGHLPRAGSLRALSGEESLALGILLRADRAPVAERGPVVFTSALALGSGGRVVLTVPGHRSLPHDAIELGVVMRVPWGASDLSLYQQGLEGLRQQRAREVAELREMLGRLVGTKSGDLAPHYAEAVAAVRGAVYMVPPVLFYEGMDTFSNLRDPNNLTGKTMLPSHPDCFFHLLAELPLDLWTDQEVVVVGCLWLLYCSGGPNRLESANGWQLSLENVADNLRYQAASYAALGFLVDVPQSCAHAEELAGAALELAAVRARLVNERRLYYRINATTRRKVEHLFEDEPLDGAEEEVCARVAKRLPGLGPSFEGVLTSLAQEPHRLAGPVGHWPTGFEAVIEATVSAARDVLDADYAMSRGLRSLTDLVDALRAEDWERIIAWELPAFYCCVKPSPAAVRFAGDDWAKLADSAWAIASRMQYNTWHVMPGNLPKSEALAARDFLAPHALPDIAVHSDLHHRGHVANKIRYSARSPETVVVAGTAFKSLTDLRVLRCEGPEFVPAELATVAHIARFLARLSETVAAAALNGQRIDITSFDHQWYRQTIIEEHLSGDD